MTDHHVHMLKLVNKSKKLYGELEQEGYLTLDIQLIAMLIGDCSKSIRTVQMTEEYLRKKNAIH